VILTRGLVAVWLVVLTGILLAYGYWGVALFTLAAAVVHVVWAYRVYRAMSREGVSPKPLRPDDLERARLLAAS